MAKQKTRKAPTLETVNTGAAAVDIGSREHMAAVNPDVDSSGVWGRFTHNLHDLAAWFKSHGVHKCCDGIHGRLLDSSLRDTGAARLRGYSGECALRQERAGPKDGRE